MKILNIKYKIKIVIFQYLNIQILSFLLCIIIKFFIIYYKYSSYILSIFILYNINLYLCLLYIHETV